MTLNEQEIKFSIYIGSWSRHGMAMMNMKNVSWLGHACQRAMGCVALLMLIGSSQAAQGPKVVDDMLIRKQLPVKIGALVDGKKCTSGKALQKQLQRKSHPMKLAEASSVELDAVYEACADSVVSISSVYKCNKCTNWHSSGVATAWVLSANGLMVTNYHVFAGKEVAGFGVRTRDGKFAAVVEVLAASKKDDVAIFRVDGTGFKPLAMGPDAKVGSDIHIIAHPDGRFFTYTAGEVSRYYKKYVKKGEAPVQMAVTAEFAKGSSGGPVLDAAGNVVGMVASTQSIYYGGKTKGEKGPFQMVIRNCVPVSAIRSLMQSTPAR